MNKMQIFSYLILGGFITSACANTAQELSIPESSDIMIIRWEFQDFCDHTYDPRIDTHRAKDKPTSFNPSDIKAGDIIFVRNIDLFMKTMHPLIENPFVILTHGEQTETNHSYQLKYLESPKIIAWFSIHPMKENHPKYYPIPLGIWQRRGIKPDDRKNLNTYLKELRETTPKNTLLYLNITEQNHRERTLVNRLLSHKKYCLNRKKRVSFEEYLKEMARCKFAVSPRGLGPDCYRTWEALLVGTIPIVKRCVFEHAKAYDKQPPCNHSQLDDLYQGLPVLIVDSWHEINEKFLNAKYKEITARHYDRAPLYIEYWKNKITAIRATYLKENGFPAR